MTTIQRRTYSLNIDGTQIENLRVTFEITRDVTKEPNTCEVTVHNLSQETRAKLSRKDVKLTLSCGYENDSALVFAGTVRLVSHERKGASWESKFKAGDGDLVYKRFVLYETFRAGYDTKDAIRRLVSLSLLGVGNLEQMLNSSAFNANATRLSHGCSVSGLAWPVIARLCSSAGFDASIQHGAVHLTPKNSSSKQIYVQGPLLNSDTGLVGSPSFGEAESDKKKKSVLTVKCLLNNRLAPGQAVRVDALQVKGDFLVRKLKHKGDTGSTDWYTEFEAVPL